MYHYQTNVEYYLRELEWLRVEGGAFAKRYPNIASRLDIGATESVNPQVERLIESIAFLTGRVNRNIEEDFTEIPLALLTNLNPYLADPIPSMAIATFEPEFNAGPQPQRIYKGTRIETEFWKGISCYFSSCWDLDLWPLRIDTTRIPARGAQNVKDLMRIRIRGTKGYLSKTKINELRFFFGGDSLRASTVYDHLSQHLIGMVISTTDNKNTVPLSPDNLLFQGFEEGENVLPTYEIGMPSHRLLLEYYTFPEKFYFITVTGLEQRPVADVIDLLFFFDEPLNLQGEGWADLFQLNCVPIINLYSTEATPFFLDGREYEHRLLADTVRQRTTEVHSINKVELHYPGSSSTITVQPYFGFEHQPGSDNVYWWARRVPCSQLETIGVETLISFVGLDFSKIGVRRQFVSTSIMCSNRDVTHRLEVGTPLTLTENLGGWDVSLLTRPTIYQSSLVSTDIMWRLVSHLSSNYLSFSDPHKGLAALKDFIRLLAMREKSKYGTIKQQLDGLISLHTYEAMVRTQVGAWRGFRPRTNIIMEIDEDAFVGTSKILFQRILHALFEDGRGLNREYDLVFHTKSDKRSTDTTALTLI